MPKERILITVKTYPTLSQKYGETVCTAGIREDGTWVRIYPVPFRRLNEQEKYKKFDWIECNLLLSTKDFRPETRHPVDINELRCIGHMGTADNWRERRRLLLQTSDAYTDMQTLINAAKTNEISLAIFKPTEILDFTWEEEERKWDPSKLEAMRKLQSQGDLFDETWRKTFQIIPKLPYSFSYRFKDEVGKSSKLQVLDWEIGQLYWNCLQSANNNEQVALQKVKEKYFDAFTKCNLHFFLGTTLQWHLIAPNPWVIIGVLPIPYESQLSLL